MNADVRPPRQGETVVAGELPVIGKDMLELLSTAMYVEPLTIYREYVQNAADAIDAGRRLGHPSGRIEVKVDVTGRSITIRDDGSGVPQMRFARILTAIGASGKRGSDARGFRGVGRLSGLAYARSLAFRSRAAGEKRVSIITWDCQRLRQAVRDVEDHRDLVTVVQAITTTTFVEEEGPSFFEVRLDGVPRLGDDRLMSPTAVADYLSQVAPVPISPDFTSRERILEVLGSSVTFGNLEISINGDAPLTRPFRDAIPIQGGRPLKLKDVAFVEVPSTNGGVGAVGWIAHHGYEGAIHPSTRVRGLRIRAGDMQVGEVGVLADVFPEHRFDAWTVGEIHVLDPRIVPNGRRDDFERNVHLAQLKNHLGPLGRDIAHRCRTSSRERKRLRDIELERGTAAEGLAILAQGSLRAGDRDRVAFGVSTALKRAEKLIGPPELIDHAVADARIKVDEARTILERLVGEDVSAASPLDHLPPKRRAFYEEMFSLIYEHSQNRAAAKSLVDRILAKIS